MITMKQLSDNKILLLDNATIDKHKNMYTYIALSTRALFPTLPDLDLKIKAILSSKTEQELIENLSKIYNHICYDNVLWNLSDLEWVLFCMKQDKVRDLSFKKIKLAQKRENERNTKKNLIGNSH